MHKPILAFAALGGTISMTPGDNGGIVSKLGAKELLEQLPQLNEIANIRAQTIARTASCSLNFSQLFATLAWAKQQVGTGANGIIISQGTDTIEQTAFFFDLFWDLPEPFIVTGAMRGAGSVGFDGLTNLLDAATTACAVESRGRGVLVVFNDSVHNARFVHKGNTTQLHTFISPLHSPCAIVSEGKAHYLRPNIDKPRLPTPGKFPYKVMILEHSLDDDGVTWVDYALNAGAKGLVINAAGSGHVMETMVESLTHASEQMPVVICSRTGSGSTTFATYGYPGAEIDLQQRGMIMGGWLSAVKARILLLACISNQKNHEQIKEIFSIWGNGK